MDATPDTDDGPIESLREAFADVPTIEDPTDEDRERARHTFPPAAVPDEGPIPDPTHDIRKEVSMDLPLWAVESIAWRLSHGDGPLTPFDIDSMTYDYAQAEPRFTVNDGDRTLAEALADSYGFDVVDEDA